MCEEHPLFDVGELVKRIEAYWDYHLHGRALNPHMPPEFAGQDAFRPGNYFVSKGYDYFVKFADRVSEDRIIILNQAGYWANQSYIVRLGSLLYGFSIIADEEKPWGRINQKLAGSDDVDILRRLRNEFAHSVGFYDKGDSEHRKLRRRIIAYFNLKEEWPITSQMFPIPIDGVLEPLTDGCKTYVRLLHEYRLSLREE